MRDSGVTMIELMVSIVIIGLLAGTVTLSLRGMSQRFKHEDAVQRIKHIDEQVRLHARLHGTEGQLRFDLRHEQSTIVYVPVGGDAKEREIKKREWEVAQPFRLDEVRIAGGEVSRSQIALPVSKDGVMLTYAVKLVREGDAVDVNSNATTEEQGGNFRGRGWLVFVGLTGQVLETNKQEEVDAILLAAR
ncbi:type II secretion system protein [Planctomycetota bacterium]|nr:type II secretion system protein [Planctomycetota bacterium]QQE12586.1 type II secretion system protein [Planctomycetota bacterium]